MAKKRSKARLGALLGQAMTVPTFGPKCWASRATGDAKAFVKELERQEQEGSFVNISEVRRILEDEFGISLNIATVRAHLKHHCKCRQRAARR